MRIVVKFQFEGIHQWEGCPYKDVSFLRFPHRHIFYVRAEKVVSHDDREIEIIRLKREMKSQFADGIRLGNKSCEMLAQEIKKEFGCDLVEVLEDNENGAIA